jgi:hypothetical protein
MVRTHYVPSIIASDQAWALYLFLLENIPWQEGIRTRYGAVTRKAYALNTMIAELEVITIIMTTMGIRGTILGIYLNYYENGTQYCPMHRHPGTCQLVISLGATRAFKLGNQIYSMNNGDAIVFGSSLHGVLKDESIMDGRISIAVFID